ncbi:MAG: hypothetical protein ABH840_04080 [Nanoarchaeota archaeon]
MKIVSLDEVSSKVLLELEKIKSNERGKLINLKLIEVSEEFDFGERNIVIGNEKLFLDSLGKFARPCFDLRKVPSLIMFSKKFDIDNFRRIIDAGISMENVLLVGAENLSAEEISFLAQNRIRRVGLGLFLEDISDACEVVMEFASGKELFLMFDFSVMNSFGISSLQAKYILSRVGLMKNLNCAYFSGISENDEKICAKLMSELI